MTGPFPAGMAQAADALYQAELAKMREIAAEERRLRDQIARLDEQRRAIATAPGEMTAMRSLGADILWQGWVGRRKEDLNMRLANVLVRKREAAAGLGRAFGRNSAVGELQAAHEKARCAERARAREERAIDDLLLRTVRR